MEGWRSKIERGLLRRCLDVLAKTVSLCSLVLPRENAEESTRWLRFRNKVVGNKSDSAMFSRAEWKEQAGERPLLFCNQLSILLCQFSCFSHKPRLIVS